MTDQNALVARAERAFRPEGARHEKGSALELIAAEAKATENKTARLRALRLQQAETAAAVPEPAAPARKTRKPAAARR